MLDGGLNGTTSTKTVLDTLSQFLGAASEWGFSGFIRYLLLFIMLTAGTRRQGLA